MPLTVPENYVFDLNPNAIKNYLPNLVEGINFDFTSLKTDDYNCVAWALNTVDEWIQFKDANGEWDIQLSRYIDYFTSLGFAITTNTHQVDGLLKIAIYSEEKTGVFTHIARQLDDGIWTSKLGEWEDIKHSSLEVLAGPFYGTPTVIMEIDR